MTKWLLASSRLVKTLMAGWQWEKAYWHTSFYIYWLHHRIINNFHVGDFDSLPDLDVTGEKVSYHGLNLWFLPFFSKTLRDIQIPNMEVLDTEVRNLYTNICAP